MRNFWTTLLFIGCAHASITFACGDRHDVEEPHPSVDPLTMSILFDYVRERNIDAIVGWVSEGNVLDAPGQDGNYATHLAAELGFVDILEVLLNAGANADTPNAEGNTPMHVAVENDQGAIVAFLSYRGANPERRNSNGQSPRQLARQRSRSGHGRNDMEDIVAGTRARAAHAPHPSAPVEVFNPIHGVHRIEDTDSQDADSEDSVGEPIAHTDAVDVDGAVVVILAGTVVAMGEAAGGRYVAGGAGGSGAGCG